MTAASRQNGGQNGGAENLLNDLPENWPLPLCLLVACLRRGLADGQGQGEGQGQGQGADPAIADLAERLTPDDWTEFARLAIVYHRVAPLIAPSLDASGLDALDMPGAVRQHLTQAVRQNAAKTLAQIAETAAMRQALDRDGIGLGVLKGWPLAERLYGQPGQRHTGDLDLLVAETQVEAACAALATIGYDPDAATPKMRRRARALGNPRLLRAVKDITLSHPDKTVMVELHWQLLNYHGWPALLDRDGALITHDSQAGPLLVPEPATELIYLAAHGSLHLWGRLKWLADIAALARAAGPDALGDHLETAHSLGVARPVLLALGLAQHLFASPVPHGMAREDNLERWVLARLARTDRPATDGIAYQLGLRRMGLSLAESWRQRLGVIGYDTTRRLRLMALDMRLNRPDPTGA